MFVDRVELSVTSGKGGAGAVSFHKEKFILKGGPDGGDGGRGGDIIFEVDSNTDTLSHFRGRRKISAKNGKPGDIRNRAGRSGENMILKVPPGTQIFCSETEELLLDLTTEGEKQSFVKGGRGGLGNARFKSSTNQRPTHAQPGEKGETKQIRLELKLIADVGLVGFPNVGKSTLISVISSATPEIANYEFTTLTPKLGVVDAGEFKSFIMADIPGIIDGASDGRGLGLDFLRHIERTKVLLFMIDIANYRTLIEQYKALRSELIKYSETLSTRNYAIAITRCDSYYGEDITTTLNEFFEELGIQPNLKAELNGAEIVGFDGDKEGIYEGTPKFVLPISSVAKFNLNPLKHELLKMVNQ